MTETGIIREINGSLAIIVPDKSAHCFGCMNSECKGGGLITAENPLALPLEKGQTVEVHAPGAGILRQAAALLPPVLGFAAGFILTRLLLPKAPQAAAAIGAIFLLAAALAVLQQRKKHPAPFTFSITRIM